MSDETTHRMTPPPRELAAVQGLPVLDPVPFLQTWATRTSTPLDDSPEARAQGCRVLTTAISVGRARGVRPDLLVSTWIDAFLAAPAEVGLTEFLRAIAQGLGDVSKLPFGGREAVMVKLSHGTKLCVKIRPEAKANGELAVWAWRNNSGEWTNPQDVRVENIIGPVPPSDRRYRAAMKAWKPDGSGPMPRRRPVG